MHPGGGLYAVTGDGTTGSETSLDITLSHEQVVRLEWVKTTSQAVFKVDGVEKLTKTTNIPSGSFVTTDLFYLQVNNHDEATGSEYGEYCRFHWGEVLLGK